MRTEIWPYCVCKCGICSRSLPCRRLLTLSVDLGYHVLFGNPSCFYGNRWAVRAVEMRGKWGAQGMDFSSPNQAPTSPKTCSVPPRTVPRHEGAPTPHGVFAPKPFCTPSADPTQFWYGCAGVVGFPTARVPAARACPHGHCHHRGGGVGHREQPGRW